MTLMLLATLSACGGSERDCRTTADCAIGVCLEGACSERGQEAACTIDDDCPDDFVCAVSGLCREKGSCLTNADCSADERCSAAGRCIGTECDASVPCTAGCHVGERSCIAGVFTTCSAAPVLEAEVCGNGLDDDCAGGIDDGCEGEGEGEGEGEACDPLVGQPDAFESNETCATCHDLGIEPDGTVIVATWDIAADVDYFCFTAIDDDDVAERIVVTLDVPAGQDLDLRLFAGIGACEAGNAVATSSGDVSASERVTFVDTATSGNDGGIWVIAVDGFIGPSCSNPYTLTVRGLH